MENTRFLQYMAVMAAVFLMLATIKYLFPRPEPEEPVDYIGLSLYRPIFFGSGEVRTVDQVSSQGHRQVQSVDTLGEYDEEELSDAVALKEDKASGTSPKGETDQAYFSKLIDEYRSGLLSRRKYRNDVVVRYYYHQPDGDRADTLVDYGFYLHKRPVEDQERFKNLSSNVIYYGQDFPKRDIKLIAYLLIENGMEIKSIRKFKDFDGWKSGAIEIGADTRLEESPVISLSELRRMFE